MKEFWSKYNQGKEELVKDKLMESKEKKLLTKMSKDGIAIEKARQIVKSTLSVPVEKCTTITEYTFSSMDKPEEPMNEVTDRRRTYEEFDNMSDTDNVNLATIAGGKKNLKQSTKNNANPTSVELDNTKFAEAEINNKLQMLGSITKDILDNSDSEEEDELKDDDLGELYGVDDFALKEFEKVKKAVDDAHTPKDKCNFLPGWGTWAGPNIKIPEKFIQKHTDKAPVRRKSKFEKGNVIYNEKADMHENIRKRMVSQLPYPFRSVSEYEASMQGAIGRTFVPEAVHRNMIKPAVVRKMGHIIKPMDKTQLMEMPEVKKAVEIKMKELEESSSKNSKKKKRAPKVVDVGTGKKRKFTRKSAD